MIGILYRVISDTSVLLTETTPTISDSIETGSPVQSKIVRMISLGKTVKTRQHDLSCNYNKYPCNITLDIFFNLFIHLPRIFLEQKLIYHEYF